MAEQPEKVTPEQIEAKLRGLQDELTGRIFDTEQIPLAQLLATHPVALLAPVALAAPRG